ncbi:MAG: fumarylacetoacetate hydrolase family protein, partial [Actinomycetota bacterium]
MRIVRYSHQGDVGFGIHEDETVAAIGPHPFGAFEYTGQRVPVAEVRLLAPVLPSKVVAVGRNYAEHARELGNEVPPEPVLFLKPSTSVIGPGDPILRPEGVGRVDFEGELAVVVGKLVRRLSPADAIQAVLGFTCANDVTARDLQRADGQWTRAKGFDTFCPIGPWIVTDLDVGDLEVRCEVGRDPEEMEVRQLGRTKDM